jgi:hypothetical protein
MIFESFPFSNVYIALYALVVAIVHISPFCATQANPLPHILTFVSILCEANFTCHLRFYILRSHVVHHGKEKDKETSEGK